MHNARNWGRPYISQALETAVSIVRPDPAILLYDPAIRYSMFSEEFAKLIDAPVQDLGDVYMIGSRV